MRAYLRSLNPQLPRPVQVLQLGGLANALGNGIVLPFLFIYLHNVRGFGLGIVGLVVATNGAVSLVITPVAGTVVDRLGGRWTLLAALAFLTVGYGGYALASTLPAAFATSAIAGVGNGAFWPAQSSLIAGLTPRDKRPAAFSMQRVVMNLGIGLGGLIGGLIASTDSVWSFRTLFLVDAATFVVYSLVVLAYVPEPTARGERHELPGTYRDVLRHRVFLGVIALNTLFILAGMSLIELLPVYMKNHAGVTERGVGIFFFVNTIVIVVLQLPITKLSEGRRRMRVLLLLGLVWAAAIAVTPLIGNNFSGTTATVLFSAATAVFAIGECLHGAVQAPLVTDLALPRLMGRYMALSAFSWQIGFTLGPAVGGFLLAATPNGVWVLAAAICVLAGFLSLVLERAIPADARRSPARGVLSAAPG